MSDPNPADRPSEPVVVDHEFVPVWAGPKDCCSWPIALDYVCGKAASAHRKLEPEGVKLSGSEDKVDKPLGVRDAANALVAAMYGAAPAGGWCTWISDSLAGLRVALQAHREAVPQVEGERDATELLRSVRPFASGPYRVACDKHNEHRPIFTDGRPLLDDRCPWCVIDALLSKAVPQECAKCGRETARHCVIEAQGGICRNRIKDECHPASYSCKAEPQGSHSRPSDATVNAGDGVTHEAAGAQAATGLATRSAQAEPHGEPEKAPTLIEHEFKSAAACEKFGCGGSAICTICGWTLVMHAAHQGQPKGEQR